jgi:hypothetical protein
VNAPPLLDKHLGLCIGHARGWLEPVLRAAPARLLTPGHASTQGLPREAVAKAVEFLQACGGALADAFERELGRQLRADVAPSRSAAGQGVPGLGEWKLVDEDEAAEEVEVVRTIQLVEGGAEWELRELQARSATLRGQTAVTARSNPLRPEVVARSLWAAAAEVGLTGAARRVLLRAASDPLTPAMQQACRDAIGWLNEWGVEPAAWKVSSVASGRLPGPLPSLTASLQEGLTLSTLPPTQRQAVADELLERHTEMLKGAKSAPAAPAAPSPEEIVRRLHDETVEAGGVDPRLAPPSVIDERHLDTMPAEMADAAPAVSLRWLDGALPGLWCHAFLRGAWRASRLIWVSETRAHWLFVSDPGVTHSLTVRAVERLARDGLLAPLEQRNLLERAIDGWLAETRTRR